MIRNIPDLLGRILIGLFFFVEAIDIIVYFEEHRTTLSNYGIGVAHTFLLVSATIILLLGALMVISGYFARLGALLLFIYWFTFTLIVYSFWDEPVDASKNLHLQFFMRNMALCGGLLVLAANGARDWGVKRIFHVLRLPK